MMIGKRILLCCMLFCCLLPVFSELMTIRILCWEGYAEPYIEGFKVLMKKKHNLDLSIELFNLSVPDEFFNFVRLGKIDLMSPAHNLLKSERWPYIKSGLVVPLNLDNIPNYAQLLPFLQKNRFVTIEGDVYAVPYTMGTYGLAYNAAKVKEPQSWNVLWEPKSKGKISITTDYYDCNIYITALSLGASYTEIYNSDTLLKKIPENTLQNKLNDLADNALTLWGGVADYKDFNKLFYATTWGYAVQQANQNGANWKMAKPVEGATAWVDHWAITNTVNTYPYKKQILEEWINYMLSPEVQIGVIRNWGVSPVIRKDTIQQKLSKDEIEIFNVGNSRYFEGLSLWETQDIRTQNRYKIFWDKAVKNR